MLSKLIKLLFIVGISITYVTLKRGRNFENKKTY
jgi:hypothetical protein